MKCPSCGHANLTDFPFCEQCLTMLPASGGAGAFDLAFDRLADAGRVTGPWPPFPWNPRDLEDPLIGRDRTVKQLLDGYEEVLSTWTARIHLLVSEYGMGKSRVADTFVARALEREPDTLAVRTRCPASGGPFRMWDAILRRVFEIPLSADPVDAGALLLRGVETYLPAEAAEVAAPIAYLTGYDVPGRPEPGPGMDEEALIGRGTAATARLLAAVSLQRPLLMVVDHANRASARSLALAGALEATLKGRPVMLVLSGAPELTGILPGWERFPTSRLKPLGRADSERMLDLYLAGLGATPRDLVRRILDQSLGNPYALKAIVRYLRSAGVIHNAQGTWTLDETTAWDLELPDDLEGVILAQIGRLPAADRTHLARAAVVGPTFWLGSLIALERLDREALDEPGALVSDDVPDRIRDCMERLIKLRFVERREASIPGEEAYGFRSDMHWRVASGILPTTSKERFHGIVWQWLALHTDEGRDGEHLPALALHAEQSGAPGAAARYLLRAAQRAAREQHHAEERRYLDAAAALAATHDLPTRLAVSMAMGDALRAAGDSDSSLAHYHDALHLAWRMRHRAKGARAMACIGAAERDRGQLGAAHGHLLEALRLMEAVGDQAGLADVSSDLGQLFWLRGDFTPALRSYRKAEQLYRRQRDRRGLAESIHRIGALHFDRGDVVLAIEYLEDALELRRRLDDRRGIAHTLNTLGVVRTSAGEIDRAIASLSEAAGLAEGQLDLPLRAKVANNLGEALLLVGRLDDAAEHLEQAVDWARAADVAPVLVDALRNTALLHTGREAWELADGALSEAGREAAQLGIGRLSALIERTRGDLEAARVRAGAGGAPRKACAAYRRAAEAFEAGGYDVEAVISRELLAGVLAELGDANEAAAEEAAATALRARHSTHRAGAR